MPDEAKTTLDRFNGPAWTAWKEALTAADEVLAYARVLRRAAFAEVGYDQALIDAAELADT